MPRNVALIFLILLSLPIIAAGESAAVSAPITILPQDCRMLVKQEMSLTLNGVIPRQAVVHWEADQGEILFVLTRAEAIFIAPSKPGIVTISASVTLPASGTKTPITRQCVVTSLNKAPHGLAQADEFEDFFSNWLGIQDIGPRLNSY